MCIRDRILDGDEFVLIALDAAFQFVAANALVTVVAYLFVVGEIQRVELQTA